MQHEGNDPALEAQVWAAASAALERGDPDELRSVVLEADRRLTDSTSIRFAAAIAGMKSKRYECALVAWDDEGSESVWSDNRVAENVPSSKEAADAMMAVCAELLELRSAHAARSALAGTVDALGAGLDAMLLL